MVDGRRRGRGCAVILSADGCIARAVRDEARADKAGARGDWETAASLYRAARAWRDAASVAALRALSTAPRTVSP